MFEGLLIGLCVGVVLGFVIVWAISSLSGPY